MRIVIKLEKVYGFGNIELKVGCSKVGYQESHRMTVSHRGFMRIAENLCTLIRDCMEGKSKKRKN